MNTQNEAAFRADSYMMQVADDLKNHHAVVMVGAGFSKNADAVLSTQKPMMDWSELADRFYTKIHGDSTQGTENGRVSCLSPLDLAEEVEADFGRPVLDRMLQEAIPDMNYRPSGIYQKLLSLPWNDIFTTNYDTLLERAAEQIENKRFNVIYVKEDLVNSADAPRIVKLHGSFPSYRPFIITREDYRRYPRVFAPFVNTVQQALLENTLCLIGFSGDDPNFQSWIGWIHDNLGKENSPQIYLITYGSSRHGRSRLLRNRRIAEIDIQPLVPNGSYRDCMEAFLDCLGNVCRRKVDFKDWPGQELFSMDENQELVQLTEILHQYHESYPGWLVAPAGIRLNAGACLTHIEMRFYRLKNAQEPGELSFLYEFNWMKEIALCMLDSYDISIYETVIGRNDEVTEKRLALQLALLRAYREFGMHEKWENLCRILEQDKERMSLEQQHQLIYEKALYYAAETDIKQLDDTLKQWKVTGQEPVWSLRKAGLRTFMGEQKEAENMLQEALFSVRRQLQKSPHNVALLSEESALAVLLGYVRQVKRYQADWGLGGQSDGGTEQNTKPFDSPRLEDYHAMYQTSWEHMEEYLVSELTSGEPARSGRRRTFDLNRMTYSMQIGADKKLRAATEYLRFREETAIPFRIANVHSGREAALEAACQIRDYQLERSISVLVRCAYDKDEILDRIVGRAILQNFTADECDELSRRYLEQLKNAASYLNDVSGFYTQTLAAFAARTLPGILSHLCCKCRTEVLDQHGEMIIGIYKSAYIKCYSQMDGWIRRWVSAYTMKEQQERIETFLTVPVLQTDRGYSNYPDPVDYLRNQKGKDKVVKISDSACGLLCIQAGQKEYKTAIMYRFVSLYDNGYLTSEQCGKILPLLWTPQNSLRYYPHIMPKVYVELMPDDEIVLKMWKDDFRARLNAEAEDTAIRLSSQRPLLAELLDSMARRLWTEEELVPILQALSSIYQKTIKEKQGGMFLTSLYGEVKGTVKILNRILAAALYYYPNQTLPEEMICQMRGDGMLSIEMRVLLSRKEGEEFDIIHPLEQKILGEVSADEENIYQTLLDLIGDGFGPWISSAEKKELIQILSQQILWRKDDGLKDALDIMSIIIRKNYLPGDDESWKADILNILTKGLGFLANDTADRRESETDVLHNLELRVSSAKLAGALYTFYSSGARPVPEPIMMWRKIGMDADEIADVRSAWNEYGSCDDNQG